MITVAVLTVSDSCSEHKREDISGRCISDLLPDDVFKVCQYKVVPDEHQRIAEQLTYFADETKVDIVLTTGGTGLGPRDVTPEATASVCDKMVPGLGEMIRLEGLKKTPNAVLSRAAAAVRGNTLIINLPGSPKAVAESLDVIVDVLAHAVSMMHGKGHDTSDAGT